MFHAQTCRACFCVALLVSTKRTAALSLASQLTLNIVLASAFLIFTQKSPHLSRSCLQVHFWLSLRSHLTSQDRACKDTFDSHSEVASPLKNVLANALVTRKSASPLKNVLAQALSTFTCKSTHSQDRACKCTVDFHSLSSHLSRHAHKCTIYFHSQVTPLHFIPFGKACHCGMVLFLWRSHLALLSLILPRVLCVERSLWAWFCLWCSICSDTATRPLGLGHTLLFPIFFRGASSCSNELVLATRCHLNKINRILFPLTVLRSLSFLIPSFTKINMSSYPVVRLPLTFACLLGACHRDGSLAVLFPLWLERLETLLEVVPSLYKSSSGFTTSVGSGLLSNAASRLITATG